MRVEGDWKRDGILVVRGLFDPQRVERLLAVSEQLLEQYHVLNPIDGNPGPAEATSLFQIHHPGFYFGPEAALGPADLLAILEAVADPAVLDLVRGTCNTADPMFSHTSIFFNPEAPGGKGSLGGN